MSACGHGLDLVAPASAWRTVEMSDLRLTQNLKADLEAGRASRSPCAAVIWTRAASATAPRSS